MSTHRFHPSRLTIGLVSMVTVVLLAAIAVGVANLQRDHEVKDLRHRLDRVSLNDSATAADHRPTNAHVTLMSADRTQMINTVLTSASSGFVVTAELPSIESTKTYQLWATSGGQQISVGLLGSSVKASAFTMPKGTTELRATVEPLAGSVQPTGAPVVSGSVPPLSFD